MEDTFQVSPGDMQKMFICSGRLSDRLELMPRQKGRYAFRVPSGSYRENLKRYLVRK
jgi:hypothetical protein